MPQLQVEQQMLAFEASSVPHMKQEARDRIWQRWSRKVRSEKRMTAGEALARVPMEIVYEPVKGGES